MNHKIKRAVDEIIGRYMLDVKPYIGNTMTYTDAHDNALREVLYDHERRLQALEESARKNPSPKSVTLKRSELIAAIADTGARVDLYSDWQLPVQLNAAIIHLFKQGPIDEASKTAQVLRLALDQLAHNGKFTFEPEGV